MTILEGFKTAALGALIVFLGFASYLVWVTAQSEKQLTSQASFVLAHANNTLTYLDGTITKLNTDIDGFNTSISNFNALEVTLNVQSAQLFQQLNKTIEIVNRNCPTGDTVETCGTLADIHKALNTIRGTFGTIEVAGKSFNQNQAKFYQQETDLYGEAYKAVKQFNTLLSSKDLADSMANTSKFTNNMGLMSQDAQLKFHDLLYPPPCNQKLGCSLKRAIPYMRLLMGVPEPTYFTWKLLTGK